MVRPLLLLALLIAAVPGCIEVPELEAAVSEEAEGADPPELLPIGTALAVSGDPRIEENEAEILSRRADALKAKALSVDDLSEKQELDKQASDLNLRAEELRNR